jgi:hypothetical protein
MKTDALEERIHRYLLGDLPEEEQSALEHVFLADGEVFEQVWAAENDLVDRYVRGKLAPAEKHLFEENYLASPAHRERLAFAKKLVQAADSGAEKEKTAIASGQALTWWGSLLYAWRASRLRWAAVAVVALFAATSVWLFTDNRRLRGQMNQLRAEAALEQQRTQELEKELKNQHEQSDEIAAELAYLREGQSPTVEPQNPPDQGQSRPVVSFILSPLLMRGGGEPPQLTIPKEAKAVLLRMRVQEPAGRSLQASLRTVEGAPIWSRSGIKTRPQERNGFTVSVSIPANKIPAGDYILTLSALTEANELEEINRYFFRVVKQ